MDDQHWRLEGTSATLQIVWWVEVVFFFQLKPMPLLRSFAWQKVRATFRGVPKGVYTPVLNMSFSGAMNLEDIKCRLKVELGAEDNVRFVLTFF